MTDTLTVSQESLDRMAAQLGGQAVATPPLPTPTTPPAVETPAAVAPPVPQDTPPVEVETPAEPEEPTFKLSELKTRFGEFEDLDKFGQSVSEYKTKAEKLAEIEGKYNELTEIEQYLESPYATPKAQALDAFFRATNIDDTSVFFRVGGKTVDELTKSSPVEFLALQKTMGNPEILKEMTFDQVCEAIADQYSVTTDVKAEDVPIGMKMAVAEARTAVGTKLDAAAKVETPIAKAQAKRQADTEARTKMTTAWNEKIKTLYPKDVQVEIPGDEKEKIAAHKLTIPVSEEIKAMVEKEVQQIIASQPVPVTQEATEAISNYMRRRVLELNSEVVVKQAYYDAIKTIRAEAKEEAIAAGHNPGTVVRPEKPVKQVAGTNSLETVLGKY